MNFLMWLRAAKPGESFMYHTGLLMADRQREANPDGYVLVDLTAKRVWEASRAKRIALTQRRLMPGQCEYIATRL